MDATEFHDSLECLSNGGRLISSAIKMIDP